MLSNCHSDPDQTGPLPEDPEIDPEVEPSDQQQLVGQMAGHYKLESLLGRGGVGSVWLARHVEVGSKVAIKVLDGRSEEAHQRLMREARAVNHIDSPHILPISDVGRLSDGRHFAMMEVLSGETLAERFGRGCLHWAEMQPLALQIAGALVTAHQAGVIHRDLKPENIFLAQRDYCEPRVKLLDFGIAEFVGECVQGTSQRRHCPVHGTPLYVAPEQALGEPCGPSADVYAFGVILYEALSGRPPFLGKNVVQVLVAKNREVPPSLKSWRLPEVPTVVAELVDAMLAIDPERRPLTTVVWNTILEEGARLQAARRARETRRAKRASIDGPPAGQWGFSSPTLDIEELPEVEELPDLTAHATAVQQPVAAVSVASNTAEIVRPTPRKQARPPATDEAEGLRPPAAPRARLPLMMKLALALFGGLLFGATILGAILATHQPKRTVSLPAEQSADRHPVARKLREKPIISGKKRSVLPTRPRQ